MCGYRNLHSGFFAFDCVYLSVITAVIIAIQSCGYLSSGRGDSTEDLLQDSEIVEDDVSSTDPILEDVTADSNLPGYWVHISSGSFVMGSPVDEPGRDPYFETQHEVTLTHAFEMLATEVTQEDYELLMTYNPSWNIGPNLPVDNVSWYEAAAFCNALSDIAGFERCYDCIGSEMDVVCDINLVFTVPYDCPGYRLPTEAEWEYAARSGTIAGTYNGTCGSGCIDFDGPSPVLDLIAWYSGNSSDSSHVVGIKQQSPWGLYDMLGNLSEWCYDWWSIDIDSYIMDPWGPATGHNRVIRGGSYEHGPIWIRAADRSVSESMDYRMRVLGFRPVRTL